MRITAPHSTKGLEFPILALIGHHVELPRAIYRLLGDEVAKEWQMRRRVLYAARRSRWLRRTRRR